MIESEVSPKSQPVTSGSSKSMVDRLFVLDLSAGRILCVMLITHLT